MKFTIEILKLNGAGQPEVLHSFAHSASSIHLIRESVHSVMKSPQWPVQANGFRIVSDRGVLLYRWPHPDVNPALGQKNLNRWNF